MPPKASSSPGKAMRSAAHRKSSPVVVSSESDHDVIGSDIEVQFGSQKVIISPDSATVSEAESLEPIVPAKKHQTKKRPAPPDDSDSDVEIVSHSVPTKKSKVEQHAPQSQSSLIDKLDKLLPVDKRQRKPTEKVRVMEAEAKGTGKKVATSPKKLSRKEVAENPSNDNEIAVPSDNERGELLTCRLIPFSSHGNGDESMLVVDSLRDGLLSKTDRMLLDVALAFKQHVPFINPAIASPDLLVVEKDHLVWEDSKCKAVFFTTGCVSSCHLVVPSPGSNGAAPVKKLMLFPIDGLFQQAINFFGFKFKLNQAAGQINNGVVAYATKREGAVVYNSNAQSAGSPKKKGLFSKAGSTSVSREGTFPVALPFGDEVPIYRLDNEFTFSGSDLDAVRSLPKYGKGLKDLPPYATVTVAYTVTSFATSNSASCNNGFLFNILFVLLLAEKNKYSD